MVILRAGTFEKIQEFRPAKSIRFKKKKEKGKAGYHLEVRLEIRWIFNFIIGLSNNPFFFLFFSSAPVSEQPRKDLSIPVFSSESLNNSWKLKSSRGIENSS